MFNKRSKTIYVSVRKIAGFGHAVLFLLFLWPNGLSAESIVHHDFNVTLHPKHNRLTATDRITLPNDRPEQLLFRLHPDLVPDSMDDGVIIQLLKKTKREATYRVRMQAGERELLLHYKGRLYYDLKAPDRTYARGIPRTRGQISETGVYLTGDSLWYPDFGSQWVTFSLSTKMPDNWQTVSQGRRVKSGGGGVIWKVDTPQTEIYLIAGRFEEYVRPAGRVDAMVFLRQAEPKLAETYLEATSRYIEMYEGLIGPYPYSKFALVENSWETGFGMPSFSLMGPRVIRFPFILYSSFPHEILHNWWGNSIYPAYESGNWAEGLTAYLADHLIKEQCGQSAEYRQSALQKYRDYVSIEKDLALVEFTGRHSSATEAVGYGKAMMFFHMLRRHLGDQTFIKALQAFYQNYRFSRASYTDLQHTLETVTGKRLENEFEQWVRRIGAPELMIEQADVQLKGQHYRLRLTLFQKQVDPPYRLRVPVAVTLKNEPFAQVKEVFMDQRRQTVSLTFESRPLRLDVDPGYDLFRKLSRNEIPPALSQMYGARKITLVLPAAADQQRLAAYRQFAQRMEYAGPEDTTVVLDSDLDELPPESSVVLLGWSNRFRHVAAKALEGDNQYIGLDRVTLKTQTYVRSEHTVVFATRHPSNDEHALVWIGAGPEQALPGLARKLPHYHKYSYLVFAGAEPQNIAKGRWQVLDSSMTVYLGEGKVNQGALPPGRPLATLPANP